MKNTYLINKGYYIKNNLESFLIYYDHFSQGITLPKYLSNEFIKIVSHHILRTLIVIVYISKIYKLKYPIVSRKEDALIIINGRGKCGNKIKLMKENGVLKIIKKVANDEVFKKEKKFYNKYKDNNSLIQLPKQIFKKNNTIEIEFLHAKSFQRSMLDGSLNLKQALEHFETIKKQIKLLYKSNKVLVHGDLWACNIFIANKRYYLIDFSESHVSNHQYDLYVLLYSILSSYNHIRLSEKTIIDYSFKNIPITNLLETTNEDLIKVEKKFINYRETRFPGVYYS